MKIIKKFVNIEYDWASWNQRQIRKIIKSLLKNDWFTCKDFFKISWLNEISSEKFITFIIMKALIQTLYNYNRFSFSWKSRTKKFIKFNVSSIFIFIMCAIIRYVIKDKNENLKIKINFELIDDDDMFWNLY